MYIYVCVYIYIYTTSFTHLSLDGHLDSFHSLAIVDIATINIGVGAPGWLSGLKLLPLAQVMIPESWD